MNVINFEVLDHNALHALISQRVSEAYGELESYSPTIKLDLLTHGIQAFLTHIDQLREWNDRVLSIKRQVSAIKAGVRPISTAKKRLFERLVVSFLNSEEFRKGLDAKERRGLAEAQFAQEEDDSLRWQDLERSLQDLHVDLADKSKQLQDAKYDIRANLMSLRLQLVLERAGTDLKDLLTETGLKKAAKAVDDDGGHTLDPYATGPEPALVMVPSDLDKLLEGHNP